jgi:hypothetical protein
MKAPVSRGGIVLRGQPQNRDHTGNSTIKQKARVLTLWLLVIIPPFTASLLD